MRVILIEDKDAVSLLEQLELEKHQQNRQFLYVDISDIKQRDAMITHIESDCHRRFHHVVTRWLQEQGARTIR